MTPQRGVLVVASAQRCPYACLAPRAEPRSREYGRLVGYDVTGFSTPFVGVQWTKTARDKDIARAVVVFLEDRRVLFADRHVEDEQHCVESVLQIRAFLTEQIKQIADETAQGRIVCALPVGGSWRQQALVAESSGTTLAPGMTRSSSPWASCEPASVHNLP